jgi:hypothetical protein
LPEQFGKELSPNSGDGLKIRRRLEARQAAIGAALIP